MNPGGQAGWKFGFEGIHWRLNQERGNPELFGSGGYGKACILDSKVFA